MLCHATSTKKKKTICAFFLLRDRFPQKKVHATYNKKKMRFMLSLLRDPPPPEKSARDLTQKKMRDLRLFVTRPTPPPQKAPKAPKNSPLAPLVGVMDCHASVWPLELGSWTPTLWCGSWSRGYGLPSFGVAPGVGVMDSHASTWPLELG